jgi:quinoprotein glucose dehydrogenase
VIRTLLLFLLPLLAAFPCASGAWGQADESKPAPAAKGPVFIDQGGADARLKGYRTPAGFKVEVAAEGTFGNAVALTFADDGAPHVIEWRFAGEKLQEHAETIKYKDGSTRTVVTRRKKTKDVVKVLISTKKDGVFDKSKVVLEEEMPTGLLLYDGWLYLCGQGTVRRWKQSKPGAGYDKKEVIAHGFGGQVSGMTLGGDGWLYLTAAAGDHFVEGSDGSRATVLRTGAIFRCKPDGAGVEVFALGFGTPARAAFDLGGNLFTVDDVSGDRTARGCRLIHAAESSDFGWRLAPGERSLPDPVRSNIRGAQPGRMPPLLETGARQAEDLLVYNDSRLPEDYRGLLFQPDAHGRRIRAYKVDPKGATFKVGEAFDFLSAAKDESFQPRRMVLGPDGALYIVSSGKKGGRIFRIHWSGTKDGPALALRSVDSWSKVASLEDKELLDALSSEETSDRERARRELVKRGDKNRKALIKLLGAGDVPLVARIAALGALESMFDGDVQAAIARVLKTGDGELQRLAAEALGRCAPKADRAAHDALLEALASDDFAVRRAVALAMGRLARPGAGDNLASALSFDDSRDRFLRDGILRGIERLGKPGIDALLALADSGVQKDTDRVVEAFLGLNSRAAFNALPALLKHRHVTSSQQADLIRSAVNYQLDPPVSLDPIAACFPEPRKETSAVKKSILDVLATPGTVKGPRAGDLVIALIDDDNREVRMQALATAARMRLDKAAPVLVKRLGSDKLVMAERLAIVRAFRGVPPKVAIPTLETLLTNEKVKVGKEAFLTLSAVDRVAARTAAKELLSSKDPAVQLKGVVVVGATAEGARLVGKLYLENKLPRSLQPEVTAALAEHADKDAEAAKLLAEVKKLSAEK